MTKYLFLIILSLNTFSTEKYFELVKDSEITAYQVFQPKMVRSNKLFKLDQFETIGDKQVQWELKNKVDFPHVPSKLYIKNVGKYESLSLHYKSNKNDFIHFLSNESPQQTYQRFFKKTYSQPLNDCYYTNSFFVKTWNRMLSHKSFCQQIRTDIKSTHSDNQLHLKGKIKNGGAYRIKVKYPEHDKHYQLIKLKLMPHSDLNNTRLVIQVRFWQAAKLKKFAFGEQFNLNLKKGMLSEFIISVPPLFRKKYLDYKKEDIQEIIISLETEKTNNINLSIAPLEFSSGKYDYIYPEKLEPITRLKHTIHNHSRLISLKSTLNKNTKDLEIVKELKWPQNVDNYGTIGTTEINNLPLDLRFLIQEKKFFYTLDRISIHKITDIQNTKNKNGYYIIRTNNREKYLSSKDVSKVKETLATKHNTDIYFVPILFYDDEELNLENLSYNVYDLDDDLIYKNNINLVQNSRDYKNGNFLNYQQKFKLKKGIYKLTYNNFLSYKMYTYGLVDDQNNKINLYNHEPRKSAGLRLNRYFNTSNVLLLLILLLLFKRKSMKIINLQINRLLGFFHQLFPFIILSILLFSGKLQVSLGFLPKALVIAIIIEVYFDILSKILTFMKSRPSMVYYIITVGNLLHILFLKYPFSTKYRPNEEFYFLITMIAIGLLKEVISTKKLDQEF